jgi:hypothetical protein
MDHLTLSEIRLQLLQQHGKLRDLVAKARDAIATIRANPVTRHLPGLGDCLDRLARAVSEHNDCEERLLGSALGDADAWCDVRVALMTAHHRHEHETLSIALRGASALEDPNEAADIAAEVLASLLAHMTAEEKDLLDPNVLRDGYCASQALGG